MDENLFRRHIMLISLYLKEYTWVLKLHLLSVKSTNLTHFETSKALFSNIFFLDYLTTIFITNINKLYEIGKDLKWRTTYLEAASLPV